MLQVVSLSIFAMSTEDVAVPDPIET